MSKLIKVTQECIDEIRKDFEEALSSGKFSDGKVTFTKTFGSINRKATVYFTEIAWLKMQTLVREFDKEVAWHGVATRGDDPEKDEYIISDILVYPQEVTGATVTTDQQKYQMWLMSQEDEVFNNIRFQGHSHVNMGVTPSGVDTTLYDGILEQLEDDMFYIFMIWNKRKEKTVKIYDMKKNVLFETADVTVEILEDDSGIEKWLKEAKELVKDRPVAAVKTGYNYGNSWYQSHNTTAKSNQTDTKAPAKDDSKKTNNDDTSKKKFKRKGAKKNVNNACDSAEQIAFYHKYGGYGYFGWEDDYDDAFYANGY